MDLIPALTDTATGLLVAAVLLVRYGVILPGTWLHHLIGWRGYPLGWTPDPCRSHRPHPRVTRPVRAPLRGQKGGR